MTPVDRTVYRNLEQVRTAISQKTGWKEVPYEDLTQEAMKNRMEQAVSRISNNRMGGGLQKKESIIRCIWMESDF